MPMKHYTLTDQWVDVGPCPIHVRVGDRQNVFIHYGNTMPTADEKAVLPIYGPAERAHHGTGENCFIRVILEPAEVVVTTILTGA